MDLMEYRAQELYAKFGVNGNYGVIADSLEELESKKDTLEYPLVVKAQVKIGGRGKAGGVKFADNYGEAREATRAILGMDIKGHTVRKVMLVKRIAVRREFYLSVILDRVSKSPVFIFSPEGGMEIERLAKEQPEKIYKTVINPLLGAKAHHAAYFASVAGLDKPQTKELTALMLNLYRLFTAYNCTLCEINPLVVTEDGHIMALDGKISIDDSAVCKFPDIAAPEAGEVVNPLVAEAANYNFLYIPCDPEGDVAVISNGSGMIMSCIDHIAKHGYKVRAALDLGGGSVAEKIKEAVRIILKTDGVTELFINIFGGITRCSEVALGIKMAIEEYGITSPIIVRFEGTNKELALETIRPLDTVIYVDGLISGVEELCRLKEAGREK